MKVAWRKIGRVVKKVVETVFLLEEARVINIIPDGAQGRIIRGAGIVTKAVEAASGPAQKP